MPESKAKKGSAGTDPGKLTFEQAIAEVEQLLERMERDEIDLTESIDAYQRGQTLLRHCRTLLESAEQRIETLRAEHAPAEDFVSEPDDGADEYEVPDEDR